MFQVRFASLVASVVVLVASIVSILALSSTLCAQVQPPEVEWDRTYGGAGYDRGFSAEQTLDGGYIVAGATDSFGVGSVDVYLVRTDGLGNLLWEKTYGGSRSESGRFVSLTIDGGYIVAGDTNSFGAGKDDVYLVKTDRLGNLEWEKTFGGAGIDRAESVQQATDGGYILGGVSDSFGGGDADFYLVKTDILGNLVWQKTYGGTRYELGYSVQQTSDGGFVMTGGTSSFGTGGEDVYLVKTDWLGDLVWQRTFGGVGFDRGYSLQSTTDGGYIIVGATTSVDAHGFVYLVKTDGLGNLDWQKTLSKTSYGGYSVQQTMRGGYVVSGDVEGKIYSAGVDRKGNLEWEDTFGVEISDWSHPIRQTTDGGYLLVGTRWPVGADTTDAQLIKLTPEKRLTPRLNIFDPSRQLWLPLTEQVRKDWFKPALPVVVIVHGWNSDLLDTLPSYTNDLASVIAARLPNVEVPPKGVNILAWDWLQEAKGKATQPNDLILGPNPSALHVWDQSKKLARALQQLFQADPAVPFTQPVHLMGHSNGAFLVALTAIVLQSPSFGNGVYPVANVTLWDPPNLIRNSLDNNVPYLRRVHGTTVDLISGSLNTQAYFSTVWVAVPSSLEVPGQGHDTYRWYQAYASADSEPTLRRSFFCGDPILTTTVGFGASLTHASPDRQLRFTCQPAEPPVELDVSLVSTSLFACTPTDHLVFAQYCITGALTSTPVITARVDQGIDNLYCDCTVPGDLRKLRMRLRRLVGIGGGAGADPGPLEATYTLPQTIAPEFDSVSFTYRIEAAPTPATFTVSVDDGGVVDPLFLATSAADLGQGDRDSTTLNITPYHGKEVNLIFSLTSDQPDAVVEVFDLTYWTSATHGNTPPVADAVTPQTVAAAGVTTPVTLDGSASFDPDGDELTYVWALDDSAIATGPTPTVDLPLGVYQFTLHVRDPYDAVASAGPIIVEVEHPFLRSDSNADGDADISDVIRTLFGLFAGLELVCQDAADANDDGTVDIADPIFTLSFLFLGSTLPPEPFSQAGLDPTSDLLGCDLLAR